MSNTERTSNPPPGAGDSRQLTELGHQVEETRKQMIKTSNLVGNLAAEVKAVARQHQPERRGLSVNSAVAYVLFVAIIGSAFYFVYRSQVERLDVEKNALLREHTAARASLETLQKKVDRRKEAEEQAAAFYRLSRSGNVRRALERYQEIAQLPLSPVEAAVFQDWVGDVRRRLSSEAYSAGMQAVEDKHWKRAAMEFREALRHMPDPPQEASLRYYLGFSLMKLGNYKEAAEELERALDVGAEKTISREVRYHLGTIYELSGQRRKAIDAYEGYIKRHPGTSYARAARRKLKGLK
jgi:TolA-binding protein